ncbi:MAG: hypothetical protein ACD_80C00040G0001, partial [uncultured bacterium (gcode 4)]
AKKKRPAGKAMKKKKICQKYISEGKSMSSEAFLEKKYKNNGFTTNIFYICQK